MRIMVSLLSISVLPSEKYCKALLNEVAVDILMKQFFMTKKGALLDMTKKETLCKFFITQTTGSWNLVYRYNTKQE